MRNSYCITIIFIMLNMSIKASQHVSQWELFEQTFTCSGYANPFTDVQFSAEFRFRNRVLVTEGFYDGEGIYKIRFMPDAEGEWTYVTKSNVAELDKKTGKFYCTTPLTGVHGPVHVRNTFDFGYADGTPYYPVGTTCYAWVWQGDEMVNKTLKTLSGSAFNKIRMGIFPKQYDKYIQNEPELYPFEGSKQKGWDYTRFNPVYFQYFEGKIEKLMMLGVEADVILFHPYDWGKWGFDAMPPEVNERYLRNVIARFAAYRNVWWSMANEWDMILSKNRQDWERLFRIVQEYDPYRHLLSIHNGMTWYDVSKPYISHLSVQTTDFFHIQDWRALYGKPVVIDECVYEGDVPNDWGNLTGEEMTSRFWQVYCRGGYCTHGETYMNPQNILWWSKGGSLYGKSPERIGFLRKIMEQRPVDGVVPFHNQWNKEMYLVKDKEYYLFYYGNSQQKLCRLLLPADRQFTIDVIDTWEMTISTVHGTFSGETEISIPGKPWMAVRATIVN